MQQLLLALLALASGCFYTTEPGQHRECPTFAEWIEATMPRVMCVGDSITEGTDSDGGYRSKLNDRVAGLTFVGPYATNNRVGLPLAHAGLSGERADEIDATASADAWMATYTPDIVLIQAGTNDLIQAYTSTQTRDHLDALALTLATDRPAAKIVILSVPFGTYGGSANIPLVNAALPAVARAHRVAGRDVVYYDAGNFLVGGDMAESTHPTLSGYGKIADELERVLRSIYRDSTL